MDPKLQYLLENRPSIIRNSLLVWIVRVSFGILAPASLFFGLAFVVCATAQETFILDALYLPEDRDIMNNTELFEATIGLGILLVLVSFLFYLIVWLCRKLIKRNKFLLDLENWRYEQEKMEKQKTELKKS